MARRSQEFCQNRQERAFQFKPVERERDAYSQFCRFYTGVDSERYGGIFTRFLRGDGARSFNFEGTPRFEVGLLRG